MNRGNPKKEKKHAPRKTQYEAKRPPQEDSEARQRLFPDQIKALPGGPGGRGAGPEVCLHGPAAEEAPVPLAVDCAHCRSVQAERNELLAVHQRTEEGRR